jgi:hypothetical protein
MADNVASAGAEGDKKADRPKNELEERSRLIENSWRMDSLLNTQLRKNNSPVRTGTRDALVGEMTRAKNPAGSSLVGSCFKTVRSKIKRPSKNSCFWHARTTEGFNRRVHCLGSGFCS